MVRARAGLGGEGIVGARAGLGGEGPGLGS